MRGLQGSNGFVERRPMAALTPEYEDFGLFKSDILPVAVNLAPIVHRTNRQDLVVRGHAEAGQAFEVVFAGRRAAMAGALLARLDALRTALMRRPQDSLSEEDRLDALRLPVLVEGVWRRRYWVDEFGWQQHMNQLIAARWSLHGEGDCLITFGQSPCQGAAGALTQVSDWATRGGDRSTAPARHN